MRVVALIFAVLMPVPSLAQDHIMTCGLADCSELDNPFVGMDDATVVRMQTLGQKLDAIPPSDIVELVALSIGQVGCYEGWPADDMTIEPYYASAMVKMVRNLGLAPDEAVFFESGLSDAFWTGIDELAAQGRLVSVTEYDDELIPAACVTAP